MHAEMSPSPRKSALVYFFDKLPPWAAATCAIFFLFTLWSIFTGFSLGDIMNKYADAELTQNQMQFEAQLEMQRMQFNATEQSNTTLAEIKKGIDTMQASLGDLNERVAKLEITTGLVVAWSCVHERSEAPQYCDALK